jgi:hypothetical protein
VSFVAIILYVASERVFIVVSVYFVIDSVRKLLDTVSYASLCTAYGGIFVFVFMEGPGIQYHFRIFALQP